MENLIIKSLTNTISDDELITLQDWLKHPKNKEHYKSIVKTNQSIDCTFNKIDTDLAYANIEKATVSKKVISLKQSYRKVFQYAAIVLVLISVSIGINSSLNTETSTNLITLELEDGTLKNIDKNLATKIYNSNGEIIAKLENSRLIYTKKTGQNDKQLYNKITVPNGETLMVILSDGTEVAINSGSNMKYPTSFLGEQKRSVFLEGEAFFEVSKNKNMPFVVHTKDMDIRVLGTKFNVSSYKNDNSSSVTLKEGSVGVNKPKEAFDRKKSIIIKPGQQVFYKNKEFTVKEVSVPKHIAWKKRELQFKNDRFEDIIKKLERYYDIKIENQSAKLNNTKYTGTFTTETISEVLNVFKELSDFSYQINSSIIIITID